MILAINTSTPQFGLAFLDEDGTILAEYFMSKEKGRFGSLMPALDFLLSKLNADIHDQQAIVVATGPGSFTGLRVGLSTAKGLCHGLGVPLIGIILHSRKEELYAAQFIRNDSLKLLRSMDDIAIKINDFPSIFDKPSIFIGNDFSRQGHVLTNMLGTRAHLAPPHCWNLKASAVGALGVERFHARSFDDPQTLEPVYLRPPDIGPNPFPLMAASSGDRESDIKKHRKLI
ncbi:MAG: tRNA (adenosine(37)-N6)-threonylcarbamoyltransferase complex dimerization subunit type 1 TsaB [Deltaproteobacteria bacterium]|nr:tRNA (adenosine(37)-N6)-threonylcarbamoyltransferase complex dimerization subunit type 1 TsaB [Deltaproteobacteria bacterium]